jgi:acetyl esterase/lipase
MAERLRKKGASVDLVEIPGGQHAMETFPTSFAGVETAIHTVAWLEKQREQAHKEKKNENKVV